MGQVPPLTEAGLLGGIHHVRLHSAADLSATVAELPAYVSDNPEVMPRHAAKDILRPDTPAQRSNAE